MQSANLGMLKKGGHGEGFGGDAGGGGSGAYPWQPQAVTAAPRWLKAAGARSVPPAANRLRPINSRQRPGVGNTDSEGQGMNCHAHRLPAAVAPRGWVLTPKDIVRYYTVLLYDTVHWIG